MFGYLVLLFTLLPALELYVLIQIGSVIGASSTILIIITTGIIGAYLARLQGFLTIQKIQQSLQKGQIPSNELMDGLIILVGGIVLLTPGFITDFLGFVLLIPLTRNLIKLLVGKRFENALNKGNSIHINKNAKPNNDKYTDIDV